jgi:protein-L-isoaspartate(D-aspartate) O-methyltransferase
MRRTNGRQGALCVALAMLVIVSLDKATAQAQWNRKYEQARSVMVETDIATAGIKQPAILAAMRATPRHEFVPAELRGYAYFDMALPIGEHQTISPPFIVAWMTQMLDPRPADRVLEIGTGSGYQAAVLSELAKDVYTIEINPVLAGRVEKTFKRLKYKNISLKQGDGYQGWSEHAPFDKIIVTCSPEEVPAPLVEQLREGGRIVIPLGERYQQTLFVMHKHQGRLVVDTREPTFFVPMTGKAETLRVSATDLPLTELVNGGFEAQLDGGKPAGWYYVRQAALGPRDDVAGATQVISFSNRVPGRGSQALQAIGVDGRRVGELSVSLLVKGNELSSGQAPDQLPKLLVSFFDDDRNPVGEQLVGPFKGSFAWTRRSARLKVPNQARVAIIAVGLLGGTGELSCDDIQIVQGSGRVAGK